jgi:uncharacterized protein with FMN-binding domain
MKRVILAVVSTVASLVLLLSFKTHSPSAAATPPAAISTSGTSAGSSGGSSTSGGSSSSSSTKKSTTSSSETYTGDAAMTRYGPVQVQVTVKDGAVTNVAATEYPMSDPRDAQINSYAIPQLDAEATSAGSTNIDMVSGATYTSDGYLSSLQSALDKAGL